MRELPGCERAGGRVARAWKCTAVRFQRTGLLTTLELTRARNSCRMFSTIRQTQALFSSFQGTSMLALGDEGEEFDLQVRQQEQSCALFAQEHDAGGLAGYRLQQAGQCGREVSSPALIAQSDKAASALRRTTRISTPRPAMRTSTPRRPSSSLPARTRLPVMPTLPPVSLTATLLQTQLYNPCSEQKDADQTEADDSCSA